MGSVRPPRLPLKLVSNFRRLLISRTMRPIIIIPEWVNRTITRILPHPVPEFLCWLRCIGKDAQRLGSHLILPQLFQHVTRLITEELIPLQGEILQFGSHPVWIIRQRGGPEPRIPSQNYSRSHISAMAVCIMAGCIKLLLAQISR